MNDPASPSPTTLADRKRLLVEKLLQQKGHRAPAEKRIPRRSGDGPAPLSFAQQRLWFLHQLEPRNSAYHISEALRVRGALGPGLLRQALQEVVRRHEMLRSVFLPGREAPVQQVGPAVAVALPEIDLRALPEREREAVARALVSARLSEPFDLERGPLLRFLLLRLGQEEWVLAFVLHHIVTDGWSMGLLVREVSALYESFERGAPPALPELPIQYSDFAVWQREWLSGEVLAAHQEFWQRALAGAPPVLDLPTDRPRPPVQTWRGSKVPVALPPSLTPLLHEVARSQGATLFLVLLAAYQILLARHSGQLDLVVGSPQAGRNRPETEGLIGLFLNMLVLRTDLSGDPTFLEAVARARETLLNAGAHQDMPFERLLDLLEIERDLSRNPLFQVQFAFQNLAVPEVSRGSLTFSRFGFDDETAQFDLSLYLGEVGDVVAGSLEYSTDLFDRDSAHRLARHLETLLRSAAREPSLRISELALMSEAESHQILEEWNDTRTGYAGDATLDRLFEERAREAPGAVSVRFEEESWTYAELDARAIRLARLLRGLGCGPETRVAVILERSPEMVLALLGVLKAGAAYLPIDPEYPADRIAFMLGDSGAPVLLTQSRLTGALPAHGATVLCLDEAEAELSAHTAGPLAGETDLRHPAYVIYTSGSTGRPKGVVVPHGGIRNRLLWMQERYRLTPADRVLQKTPFSFDVSVWEFFWPLLAGARIVLARPGGHRDGPYLVETIAREGVTVLHFVPSMLQAFLEQPGLDACSSLRLVMCSGEALPAELAERFHQRLGAELHNLYGPTEASVDVTSWACEPGPRRTVPIGRPIANTRIHLLDRELRPVPIGVPGELHIGGGGLARGYLERADLTAERFVPDPLASEPGDRLYRTGDLARHGRDGAVEFLGRLDHQVKLRGFRIELAEIESVLAQHPAVRETVVLVDDGAAGQKRLVAYVVASPGEAPALDGLLRFAREKLPDYMLPTALVTLAELPLTPNGKADRRALAALSPGRTEARQPFVAPRTPREGILAEVWEQVLKVDKVGVDDNFFALGGDSILSLQVLARARERGLAITLQQIFQHQTVTELAREVSEEGGPDVPRLAPFEFLSPEDRARLPEGVEDAYPLARLQEGMLFHGELSADSSVYHNTTSVHLRTRFDGAALCGVLYRMASRHPLLRTSFDLSGYTEPLQLVHRNSRIPLAIVDLRHLAAEEQKRALDAWFESEKRHLFDWKQPPLLRFHVHLRSAETFQLSWSEHHAILDGWSVASMVTELIREYHACLQGGALEAEVSGPASRFRDFVALERHAVADPDARRFWIDRLADSSPLELPLLAQAPGSERIETLFVPLPPELSEGARSLARSSQLPLKSVLLAVHLRVLSFLSGQSDLITGLVANGRLEETDGERVLGLFLNSLPLRASLPGGSWLDLVRECFEAEREMLPHRRFPLAEIQRITGGQPLFEVAFTFLHYHVYQSFADFGNDIEVLSVRARIPTNFLLSTYFQLDPLSSRLSLLLDYDASRLSAERAQEIAETYKRALTRMVERPDARYEESLAATGPERLQAAFGSGPDLPVFGETCLHETFEARVESDPEAPALSFEGRELTYGELNRQANRLAYHLRHLGAGPETLVGLFTGRSPATVVGLLGILKAGGAYLPLDPTYPRDRLAFLLEDSGVGLVVTDDEPAAELPATGAVVVNLDRDVSPAAPAENPRSEVSAASLAYVIYTSGSTGRPKGTLVSHGNAARLFRATDPWFGFGPSDVWTLFHSPAFDFSVWEIWGALLYGGRLVVVPYLVSRSPSEFRDLLIRERVTVLNQTPSAFRQLAQTMGDTGPGELALRWVIFGGEALDVSGLAPWFERYGDRSPCLINMYGITETTVHVTYRPLSREDCRPPARSVVGVPIPDLRGSVVDRWLQPVPDGAPGELLVGGAGLSRGYLGRPGLTAGRFVPDPFGSTPGARLYRSGDLVRRLPGGDLEYLGRIDQQVKIRGFRVELGEVEAALRQHPAVLEAAVLLREDSPGEKSFVAYVVPSSDPREILGTSGTELEGEQVLQWQMVFDRTYEETSPEEVSPAFNITGWNSSYTGDPIPQDEMEEWVEATVERLRALSPVSVLEIGCGTGLLLSRLAPDCATYWGTDFSEEALRQIRRHLGTAPPPGLLLLQREARDFSEIPERAFDLVVVNSVLQYFPSVDYLVQVVEGAVAAVCDGGHIFLGDVRSLPLQRAFHASVELYRAPASQTIERVRRSVLSRTAEDGELVVDPGLFEALARRLPRIGGVRTLLKRGRHENEMTRYRYDAILEVGEPALRVAGGARLDWRERRLSPGDLRRLLLDEAPDALEVTGIPNRRLDREVRAAALLWSLDGRLSLGDLRAALDRETAGEAAPDPEEVWALAGELDYDVSLSWSGNGADGRFDARFERRGAPRRRLSAPPRPGDEAEAPWTAYANDPLQGKLRSYLPSRLRADLRRTLPEHMLPSAFVLLEEIPLTAHGKLDRRQLPAPEQARLELRGTYAPPRTDIERRLTEIWAEVLKLGRIGIHDNLFEIGGHSLLATQIIVRIREAFQIEIPLRALYNAPTVAGLAVSVVNAQAESADAALLAQLLDEVEQMPLDQLQSALSGDPVGGGRANG